MHPSHAICWKCRFQEVYMWTPLKHGPGSFRMTIPPFLALVLTDSLCAFDSLTHGPHSLLDGCDEAVSAVRWHIKAAWSPITLSKLGKSYSVPRTVWDLFLILQTRRETFLTFNNHCVLNYLCLCRSNDNDETTKRKVNLVFEKIQTLKSRATASAQGDTKVRGCHIVIITLTVR